MLSALRSFQSAEPKSQSTRDTTQKDEEDRILRFVTENTSEIKRSKDALVVAIHLLILEAGDVCLFLQLVDNLICVLSL